MTPPLTLHPAPTVEEDATTPLQQVFLFNFIIPGNLHPPGGVFSYGVFAGVIFYCGFREYCDL